MYMSEQMNMNGSNLQVCSTNPMTGWTRNGYCELGEGDSGAHHVCATMTRDFLDFTKSRGNDLSSVVNENDKWCICQLRYKEAHDAGFAPPVDMQATHMITKDNIKNIIRSNMKEGYSNINNINMIGLPLIIIAGLLMFIKNRRYI